MDHRGFDMFSVTLEIKNASFGYAL